MRKWLINQGIPALVVGIVVGAGLNGELYRWLLESPDRSLLFMTINILPVLLFTISTMTIFYFNSFRMFYYGWFLLVTYLYSNAVNISVTQRYFDLETGAYQNSLLMISVAVPLIFIIVHFSGRGALLSIKSTVLILGSLVLYPASLALFKVFPQNSLAGYSWLISPPGIPEGLAVVPVVPVVGCVIFGMAVWLHSERNFYTKSRGLIFWVLVSAVVPFLPGFEQAGSSGKQLQIPVFYGLSGALYGITVIKYAWNKAYRDPLTQVRARMGLDEHLESLTGQYVIAMIDIDNFKDFNDTYGHDAGDKVLKQVAEILETKASGSVYRFGGEEFTIVYPGRELEEVQEQLDNILNIISNNKVSVTRKSNRATKQLEKTVTVSIGVSESKRDEVPPEVLNKADNALFEAKEEGRDQLKTK